MQHRLAGGTTVVEEFVLADSEVPKKVKAFWLRHAEVVRPGLPSAARCRSFITRCSLPGAARFISRRAGA